jgi:hypothetical protein
MVFPVPEIMLQIVSVVLQIIVVFILYLPSRPPALRYTPWTLPHLVDTTVSVKYNRRGEKDGKERQRTAGVPPGI